MSTHSHVSHCRVLPLGEFTVTIPEPHATLQCAVTWRNQRCDRATLQGVRIPSGILKIVFAIFFLFLMQFRLWRAAAFVSSPIHLLYNKPNAVSVFLFDDRYLAGGVTDRRESLCNVSQNELIPFGWRYLWGSPNTGLKRLRVDHLWPLRRWFLPFDSKYLENGKS